MTEEESNNNSELLSIDTQVKQLRTLLKSDKHVLIQESGDFTLFSIKLNHGLNLQFLFDPLCDQKVLTKSNIYDLRLTKTNSCTFSNEIWLEIKAYFENELKQNQFTIYDLVQRLQDKILVQVPTDMIKPDKPNTSSSHQQQEETTPTKFRGADAIFNRLLWDKTIDQTKIMIGYEDRFNGIQEITFSQWKKGHDRGSGVPMHRVRYYKINGQIVWDRMKKVDILTRLEAIQTTVEDDQQKSLQTVTNTLTILNEGVYKYDVEKAQWIICSTQTLLKPMNENDHDIIIPSESLLPDRCHFLTWNILSNYYHEAEIYSEKRYCYILNALRTLSPDIVCLQEVTYDFLGLLLNEVWLKNENYYISITKNVLMSQDSKYKQQNYYGQLLLSKNIRPYSVQFLPLSITEGKEEQITNSLEMEMTKEVILARFGLKSSTNNTIDIVNLHLHNNGLNSLDDKCCNSLKNLLTTLKVLSDSFLLMGDFNFGDNDMKEQDLLSNQMLNDLWKDVYDLDENPGYTFDPSRNLCAKITSHTMINRREDRYLLKTKLNYDIEHLNMIGFETYVVNREDDVYLNPSDHYGLQCILHLKGRKISSKSAIVIIPPHHTWNEIQWIREMYDPLYAQWPPTINLVYPYYEEFDEKLLLELRLLLTKQEPFQIDINGLDCFQEQNIIYMKLADKSKELVQNIHEQLKQIYPDCCKKMNKENDGKYTPHLTVARCKQSTIQKNDNNRDNSALVLNDQIHFLVNSVYLIRQTDDTPFHIEYQIPLGSTLERLNYYQLNCDISLREFFHSENLYESEISFGMKLEKFQRLNKCFKQIFSDITLERYKSDYYPYGSFRIGLNAADLDTVFVLREYQPYDKTRVTNLDRIIANEQQIDSKLYILQMLEQQIQTMDDVIECRHIQAMYPLISILFKDNTRAELFLDIKEKPVLNNQLLKNNGLMYFEDPVHGVHDIERLLSYVRCPYIFQYLLTFVRQWSQSVGLYGQVYGYLGGYSYAVLVAIVCHEYFDESRHCIQSLSDLENFTLENFFDLVRYFFDYYSKFDWSYESVQLYSKRKTYYRRDTTLNNLDINSRGAMKILYPASPLMNTARNTTKTTRDLIVEGM
ncbi:unnamed protein product [Didymodactylos carnosus]|uniref:Polynucleotide adenylyltransferase n=1 Tax=Didymodactylos carnosus TaxID=1234261 RepID=A0A8S2HVG7_9BILA|nr:unnamed protein product [Didymodactylos carnosus]CAF3690109.1 unnamed protein product [Didymodactylos carnosus]